MKKDFSLRIVAENNFSVINRIINIFNRRRIRIKKAILLEMEDDLRRGEAIFTLHTTFEMLLKAQLQIEKLIEVEYTEVLELSQNKD